MSSQTGQALSYHDSIRQSVRDILFTPIGGRIMRRRYGSVLPLLIDQPANPVNLMRLRAAVIHALATWEPRIAIDQLSLSLDGSKLTLRLDLQTGQVEVTL